MLGEIVLVPIKSYPFDAWAGGATWRVRASTLSDTSCYLAPLALMATSCSMLSRRCSILCRIVWVSSTDAALPTETSGCPLAPAAASARCYFGV